MTVFVICFPRCDDSVPIQDVNYSKYDVGLVSVVFPLSVLLGHGRGKAIMQEKVSMTERMQRHCMLHAWMGGWV